MYRKCNISSGLLFSALSIAIFSGAAHAENRVVEDTLIYNDPTVAIEGKWGSGIAVDYYNLKNDTPALGGPATYKFNQYGMSGWIGLDNVSVLVSYKNGDGSSDVTFPDLGPAHGANHRKEFEIDARWLMRNFSTSFLTPYVLVGYVDGRMTTVYSFEKVAGTIDYERKYTAPLVGIGAIIPVNEKIGFRVDGKYLWSKNDTSTSSAGLDTLYSSYSVKRMRASLTGYYNIAAGFNVQAGYRFEKNVSDGDSTDKAVYAMLGYSFK